MVRRQITDAIRLSSLYGTVNAMMALMLRLDGMMMAHHGYGSLRYRTVVTVLTVSNVDLQVSHCLGMSAAKQAASESFVT
jgi:hypothetical protein